MVAPNTKRGGGKTGSSRPDAHLTETSEAFPGDADHLTSEELQGEQDQEMNSPSTQEEMFFQWTTATHSKGEKVTMPESIEALAKLPSLDHGGRLDKANLRTYVRSR
ncbi:hypothetical protein F0562_015259 [Nyssa sinensis]|uniref:Uncharacterized protein n=1 Tax=Nyssa sinensis TaxID=561372 RepID=A0A5J4ZKQ5_9ASTE|nr:hypothetical protein F0562_015259 [Nyssa sinensis]